MTEPNQIKRGNRFEHKRFIIGSPNAGTARPDVCTITKTQRDLVYYRNESGQGFVARRSELDNIVRKWLQ